MRARPLLLSVPIILLVSAVIAHALVYWTPLFGARSNFGIGGLFQSDWIYPTSIDYFVPLREEVVELAKLQPEEFQKVVEGLFDELVKLSEAQLYMLNSVDEVCNSLLIDCQGVPSKNVKPFVEKALSFKQTSEANAIAGGSLVTARLSLAVAFAALLISVAGFVVAFMTYRRKRDA